MAGAVINSSQFMSGLDVSVERFEKKFGLAMKHLMTKAMNLMLAKTPVFTGQAAASYRASMGTPSSSPPAASGQPVEATNKLPLGSEVLRSSAEAQSRSTLSQINPGNDPFQVYWIVNRSPNIGGLEAGLFPYKPKRQRSPAGMFRVTLEELADTIDAGIL